MHYYILCFLSGLIWAGIAYLLVPGPLGPLLWAGMVASPFIGVIIGISFRPAYRWPRAARILFSLVTLYLAVTIFGLVVGLYDVASSDEPNRIPSAVVIEYILAFLWGVTFTGYAVLLWPLAYLNHRLLGRANERV